MKKFFLCFSLLTALAVFTACEKVNLDDLRDDDTEQEQGVKLTFNVMKFEQTSFNDPTYVTRANINELCNKINFALYDKDNTRLKYVNQKSEDKDFGKISFNVEAGTYRVVILAHSCSANATTTNVEKITFPDNKVTDTFYYFAEIQVDSDKSYDVQLKRIVSMFKLVTDDDIPENVKKFKFYYTGGSSTLNGLTGYGCVNSKQTEIRTVNSTAKGQEFSVYTFLHADEGTLKMTVTALDASDMAVKEIQFESVPMKRNTISQYKGSFFSGGGGASGASVFSLSADGAWENTNSYSY